jgi:hypothetical protein
LTIVRYRLAASSLVSAAGVSVVGAALVAVVLLVWVAVLVVGEAPVSVAHPVTVSKRATAKAVRVECKSNPPIR